MRFYNCTTKKQHSKKLLFICFHFLICVNASTVSLPNRLNDFLLEQKRTISFFHLESSDDNPILFWFLEENRHRNKFLQTASLGSSESLFQSKISVFQDFQIVQDNSCWLDSRLQPVYLSRFCFSFFFPHGARRFLLIHSVPCGPRESGGPLFGLPWQKRYPHV